MCELACWLATLAGHRREHGGGSDLYLHRLWRIAGSRVVPRHVAVMAMVMLISALALGV